MEELSLNFTRIKLLRLSKTLEDSLMEKTQLEKLIKELHSTESLMDLLHREEICAMAMEEVDRVLMEVDSQMKI